MSKYKNPAIKRQQGIYQIKNNGFNHNAFPPKVLIRLWQVSWLNGHPLSAFPSDKLSGI